MKDDDRQGECFRKYDKVEKSFDDHSLFLTTRYRYNFLFQLDIMDYTSWAIGLKEAGYATNPQYSSLLINLIERYQLMALDSMARSEESEESPVPTTSKSSTGEKYTPSAKATQTAVVDQSSQAASAPFLRADIGQPQGISTSNCFTATKDQFPKENYPFTEREVYVNNSTLFVIASAGDTYSSIAADVQDTEAKLRKYNDVDALAQPVLNEVVYIEYKSKYNDFGQYTVTGHETLHYISQKYAVRMLYLMKYNHIDTALHQGDIVLLKEKNEK